MESLVRLIVRFLLVPLGAVVASLVITLVMLVAHWGDLIALMKARPDIEGYWLLVTLFIGPVVALLLSLAVVLMVVPATIGVLISETFAIRSWIFHAANGGISAWIGLLLMRDIQDEYRFLAEPKAVIAAGLAGGLVYWLVAGCTAGFWKPIFGPRPTAV